MYIEKEKKFFVHCIIWVTYPIYLCARDAWSVDIARDQKEQVLLMVYREGEDIFC